ncbi:CDP-alcohol phosphatidyltransferase [Roseovarius sp. A-2]|uniref:CDP-alcohol phosphatidyltransferase family protein n=1 Tax=Roseovarius sp. A-2 TaxID=1570360 RepID=UPI0009B4FF14|nr:CDP-alcohol phosphatidyltransferase family protein [Roseovarius sp. A-2]GAW33336.1 CDP-alcohol phosphatidyltransferase [Roseovarius sp. A-2]
MTKAASVRLVGESDARLWGLELREWQRRAWQKAGAATVNEASARLLVGVDWVLSPALQRALLATPGAALIVEGEGQAAPRLAALHLPEGAAPQDWEGWIGCEHPDASALRAAGFTPGGMAAFAGDYDEVLRKREAPYALSMRTETALRVEKRLFKGSYKGVTDLVTKYAWPWPAFHATRAAARLHISPNTVTTLSLVMVFAALWCFWEGHWALGIVSAWVMTFLDTVDGKLARTTMSYSKWGDLYDHLIDLIHPPFWYWAMWNGLHGQATGVSAQMLDASLAILVIGYVLNRVQEGVFIAKFGFHIHVWERIDSIAREITARRNPNMLIFMLAVIVGAPGWGFVAMATWTLLWLIFHGVRLGQAWLQPTPITSWMEG